jgi:hypothetical protein
MKFLYVFLFLIPFNLFAEENEVAEEKTSINFGNYSINISSGVSTQIYHLFLKVEYCSAVEFNKVYYSGSKTPSTYQIICWERRPKEIKIDSVLSSFYYVNQTKKGILDCHVVKDWRAVSTVEDIVYNQIGEGQYFVKWTESNGLKKRKIYCGDVFFTETDYDPERFDLKKHPVESRTLLIP